MSISKIDQSLGQSLRQEIFSTVDCVLSDKKNIYVGYSGGVDSTCLLYILSTYVKIHPGYRVVAVHIDHGVSQFSEQWMSHCKKQSLLYGAEFITRKVKLTLSSGQGFENSARKARMQAFTDIIGSANDSVLFLGHHAKDQAETFFLRILRGCGLAGICSISPKRTFNSLVVSRPLLNLTRGCLEKMVKDLSLPTIEDDSNLSLVYDRNYIRNQILPHIENRWPAYQSLITKTLSHCQEDYSHLQHLIRKKTNNIATQKFGLFSLSYERFCQCLDVEQSLILRTYILDQGWYLPSAKQLIGFLDQIKVANTSSRAELSTAQYRIIYGRGDIYVLPTWYFSVQPQDFMVNESESNYYYKCPNEVSLQIDWSELQNHGGSEQSYKVIFLRHDNAHEVHTNHVKHLFQSKNIPVFLRPYTPFLLLNDSNLVLLEFKSI
ncbi:MAG: tRNA lysidine(34) synthetase TilS [Pseudomonadota bacterium]|nr:tRNA lysidine(34) synthetase TilS [Pseudomonadota bacterium]